MSNFKIVCNCIHELLNVFEDSAQCIHTVLYPKSHFYSPKELMLGCDICPGTRRTWQGEEHKQAKLYSVEDYLVSYIFLKQQMIQLLVISHLIFTILAFVDGCEVLKAV